MAAVATVRGVRGGGVFGEDLLRTGGVGLIGDPDGWGGIGCEGKFAACAPEGLALNGGADAVFLQDAEDVAGFEGVGGLGDADHEKAQ